MSLSDPGLARVTALTPFPSPSLRSTEREDRMCSHGYLVTVLGATHRVMGIVWGWIVPHHPAKISLAFSLRKPLEYRALELVSSEDHASPS